MLIVVIYEVEYFTQCLHLPYVYIGENLHENKKAIYYIIYGVFLPILNWQRNCQPS